MLAVVPFPAAALRIGRTYHDLHKFTRKGIALPGLVVVGRCRGFEESRLPDLKRFIDDYYAARRRGTEATA